MSIKSVHFSLPVTKVDRKKVFLNLSQGRAALLTGH